MIDWNIEPFVTVGPIPFLASASEVRAILGSDHMTFPTTPLVTDLTDAYQSIGVIVGYDANNRVETVETVRPCSVRLGDVSLLGRSEGLVIKELGGINSITRPYSDLLVVPALGLSLKVEDGVVKLVCASSRAAFERYKQLLETVALKRAARIERRQNQVPPPNPFKPTDE